MILTVLFVAILKMLCYNKSEIYGKSEKSENSM